VGFLGGNVAGRPDVLEDRDFEVAQLDRYRRFGWLSWHGMLISQALRELQYRRRKNRSSIGFFRFTGRTK
jgi:hypothetical protein